MAFVPRRAEGRVDSDRFLYRHMLRAGLRRSESPRWWGGMSLNISGDFG